MGEATSVPPVIQLKLEEIESATQYMAGLEDEMRALRRRIENHDVPAVHLGLRTIAEALLRHAAKASEVERQKGPEPTFQALKQALQTKLKHDIHEPFWRHLETIQRHVNAHAHHQHDDVYHAAGLQGRSSPWEEVETAMHALRCVASVFVEKWPPPQRVAPVVQPDNGEDEPAPATERRPPTLPQAGDAHELGNVTARTALDSDEIRRKLEKATGMERRGVTRRLNSVHGKTKLKNVFPDAFQSDDDEPGEDTPGFDYESIGNLTVKEARDNDLAYDIAILTGLEEATVRRKLNNLHGGGVIRRQFNWYDPQTVGELTARTALNYHLVPLLAREFRQTRAAIVARLREVAGQTKLRNVFPELQAWE